jgi:uncharacterized protein (TIGR02285 family)
MFAQPGRAVDWYFNGLLKLEAVLASGDFSLGVAEGRSYGAEVDAVVKRQPAALRPLSSVTPARQLLLMAQRGRLDMAMVLPYELRHLEVSEHLSLSDLKVLPLAEQPPALPGLAACSRSPQGDALMKRLNAVLADPKVQAAMDSDYEAWLDNDLRAMTRSQRRP